MSLVAYGDSDSDSGRSDGEDEPVVDKTPIAHSNNGPAVRKDDSSAAVEPKPLVLPSRQITSLNFDLGVLDKNRSQPIRITIPSLSKFETGDEGTKKPKFKPSTKGSGLFSVLPKPKNTVSASSPSLMPQALVKRTQPKKPLVPSQLLKESKKPNVIDDEVGDSEGSVSSFFFSEQDDLPVVDEKLPIMFKSDSSPTIIENTSVSTVPKDQPTYPNGQSFCGPQVHEPSQHQSKIGDGNSNQPLGLREEAAGLDAAALIKLCGSRERRKQPDLSEIIDVDGSDLLADSSLVLSKELSKEQPTVSFKRKSDCTSVERRKHQITYLAEQAKAHELELRNNWAQNRMTRKQTQAKYGF